MNRSNRSLTWKTRIRMWIFVPLVSIQCRLLCIWVRVKSAVSQLLKFIKKNKLWEATMSNVNPSTTNPEGWTVVLSLKVMQTAFFDCELAVLYVCFCLVLLPILNTQAQIGNMFFSLIGKFSFFKFEYISFLFLNTLIFFTIIGIFSSWTNFLSIIKIFSFF